MALTPSLLKDPLWRIQNLYLIRDKKRRLSKLTLNTCQQRILEAIKPQLEAGQPIRHYDLKFRQGGVSTFWLLFYLDDTIYKRNTISCILAQERDSLNHLWDIVRLAHATMPDGIRPPLKEDSAKSLAFAHNNSRLFVSLQVQSTALHNLHISEYPLCAPDEVERTIAACPPNANITLEGVANGMNHAYDKWHESEDGYTKLFHPWFLQEEYKIFGLQQLTDLTPEEKRFCEYASREYTVRITHDQIRYRRMAHKNLKHLALQEMAEDPTTCFLSTGNAFFDNMKIDCLYKEAGEYLKEHPAHKETDEYIMFEEPQNNCIYAAGADVAEGFGGDWSVLAILNVTKRTQAFRYRARVGVDKFYRVCDEFGRLYRNALLAPELNNHGHAIMLGLREDCKYPNLYRQESGRATAFGKPGQQRTVKFGWETTGTTRPVMLDKLKLAIEGKFEDDVEHFDPDFLVLDKIFLQECLTFVNRDGKIEASTGKHDDTIMAWAIAYQMYLRCRARVSSSEGLLIGGDTGASKLFGAGSAAPKV